MVPRLHFHVKEVCWLAYEQRLPVLLQGKNGPCPLIALVNTLILKDDIEQRTLGMEHATETTSGGTGPAGLFEQGEESTQEQKSGGKPAKNGGIGPANRLDVSQLRGLLLRHVGATVELDEVLACLGELLLSLQALGSDTVNVFLENLPLLHTGLEVDPNLTTGGFPPGQLATQLFLAFRLPFVHGWCRDPKGNTQIDAIFNKYQTFEAIQEYLLTYPDQLAQKAQVEAWLNENATQLTQHGLESIDQRMAQDSVAIFFRNNHFLTLYKAQNHDLYLLITDDAFLKRACYVWQSVNSVSGKDDLFFAGDFTPLLDGEDPLSVTGGAGVDENLRYAQQLQEKEDSRYAKMLQKTYEKRADRSANSSLARIRDDDDHGAKKKTGAGDKKSLNANSPGESGGKNKAILSGGKTGGSGGSKSGGSKSGGRDENPRKTMCVVV